MPEQIFKLSPDRDLQCYFFMPSAIAAMSNASSSGFTVSGKWRQQFDWAVVEWNRDNVFEHPALRNLPDGDLSGLTLTYEEERTNCVPFESNLDPVVDWDNLRIWADDEQGNETLYHVELIVQPYSKPFNPPNSVATPIEGTYVPAFATMTLVGIPAAVDGVNRVGLAFLDRHYYATVLPGDTPVTVAPKLAAAIVDSDFTAYSPADSATVIITWKSGGLYPQLQGANGNRITVYGFCTSGEPIWQDAFAVFGGGQFPSKYRVTLDFSNLMGYIDGAPLDAEGYRVFVHVPTQNVRKLRWTWAADLQPGSFQQIEYSSVISNWTVTGNNRIYSVAGLGSRRIEDTDSSAVYSGSWSVVAGNYSGSRIHLTANFSDSCTITYREAASHQLFLGLRRFGGAPLVNISVDGQSLSHQVNLTLPGEDVLIREPLGTFAAGSHSVTLTHSGASGETLYFDFLEIAYPSTNLPDFPSQTQLALATDWDTYHSQSLPAERTAWLIQKLGFFGRVNHYVGALWFYELTRTGTQYASTTFTLNSPSPLPLVSGASPTIVLAITPAPDVSDPSPARTLISYFVLLDDMVANVAQALVGLINLGTNLVWASATGDQLTITARYMGVAGNNITVQLDPTSQGFTIEPSVNVLSGGIDGTPYDLDVAPNDPNATPSQINNALVINSAQFWKTDLNCIPRINRAARDWHLAYFTALKGYGLDAVASFSTELGNGEPALSAGIAQRYPDGTPVTLNTPAVQTNFSPTALTYWKQVYLDMAKIQNSAGLTPYLQSGEVQWWYFQKDYPAQGGGMTFYDAYTKQQFQAKYGVEIGIIPGNTVDPAAYPNEAAFLPTLIGAYTAAIRTTLKAQYSNCRYEVLYPNDVNDFPLTLVINYPTDDWTPANLDCLKTESFGFTGNMDLNDCTKSMNVSAAKGFPSPKRSHLVGISDIRSCWMKEIDIAQSQGLESVVLFALDQYCLIGYPPPPFVKSTGSRRQG
ncbi:MAG TPA: hypothetical protein VGG97_10545 [Bryobacteraceae bacterium]|jgi:hypothetical protein